MLIDWSKLIKPPNVLPPPNRSLSHHQHHHQSSINITAWQGSYSNFVRYCGGGCVSAWDSRLRADLVVSFHPDFVTQPSQVAGSKSKTKTTTTTLPLANWTDDLRTLLVQQQRTPLLFTFSTSEEKQRAAQALATTFQANFMCIKPNEFSSLLLRQVPNKPNHVFATNGFSMFIRGSNSSASGGSGGVIDPVTRYLKLGSTPTNGTTTTNTPTDYLLSK